jgi:hypothetical protein
VQLKAGNALHDHPVPAKAVALRPAGKLSDTVTTTPEPEGELPAFLTVIA